MLSASLLLLAALVATVAPGRATGGVEAERLGLQPSAAGQVAEDPAASRGRYLVVGSEGVASAPVTMPPSSALIVRARGASCFGAPRMTVSVDGLEVGAVDVAASRWTGYRFPLRIAGGRHRVSIAYGNDDVAGCDRNLLLDRISWEAARGRATVRSLRAEAGAGRVRLRWAASPGAAGFAVYRDGRLAARLGRRAGGVELRRLVNGRTYRFGVVPRTADGAPGPPAEIVATPLRRLRHRLAWAAPRLERPLTVRVTPGLHEYVLDPRRDYRIVMPPAPFSGPGGLILNGGRNVVLIGGRIDVPRAAPTATETAGHGLLLDGQRGTVHVEGLRLSGGGLAEGIDLSQPYGATVQLENVRVDQLRRREGPNAADVHPDVVQTWSGPSALRIDRLTGRTDYQGLFFASKQRGPRLQSVELRNVEIVGSYGGARTPPQYLVNDADPVPRLVVRNVWLGTAGGAALHAYTPAGTARSRLFRHGRPRGGDLVGSGDIGPGYRGPGYVR